MKNILTFIFLTVFISSCRQSTTDYALQWSTEIKNKIYEDMNVAIDSVRIDTSQANFKFITYFHKQTPIKEYNFHNGDSIGSCFFSPNQDFDIVRELCPGNKRTFEAIRYKGKHVGLVEFRFCDGKLKEQGYRYGDNVGIWKEWDSSGKLIKQTEYGNADQLRNLKTIKYEINN